jgi:microcystin-dependent protein
MRGRVPVGMGQGTGLPNFSLGKADGEVTHTLTINEIPLHNHVVVCNDTASGRDLLETPNGNIMAKSSSDSCHYAASSNGVMAGTMINTAGASQPHQNMQPYTVINYIIAIEGVWPSRE